MLRNTQNIQWIIKSYLWNILCNEWIEFEKSGMENGFSGMRLVNSGMLYGISGSISGDFLKQYLLLGVSNFLHGK